jgi:hypothetical protein
MMTSPGVSIKPIAFVISQRSRELDPDCLLLEQSHSTIDRGSDRLPTPKSQFGEGVPCRSADSDRRCIAHSPIVFQVDKSIYK